MANTFPFFKILLKYQFLSEVYPGHTVQSFNLLPLHYSWYPFSAQLKKIVLTSFYYTLKYTYLYLLLCDCLPLQEKKLNKDKGFCLFCSLTYSKCLAERLTYNWCSVMTIILKGCILMFCEEKTSTEGWEVKQEDQWGAQRSVQVSVAGGLD